MVQNNKETSNNLLIKMLKIKGLEIRDLLFFVSDTN